MTEREESVAELLLSEPEIVAWLEPDDPADDRDDGLARAEQQGEQRLLHVQAVLGLVPDGRARRRRGPRR